MRVERVPHLKLCFLEIPVLDWLVKIIARSDLVFGIAQ